MQVKRELGEALAEIAAAHPGLEVDHEMILSIPGTHTDPRSWIVQSLMRAWERREGRPHTPITGTSGATDAAILRGRGIATARLGLPRTQPPAAAAGTPGRPMTRPLSACATTGTRSRGRRAWAVEPRG